MSCMLHTTPVETCSQCMSKSARRKLAKDPDYRRWKKKYGELKHEHGVFRGRAKKMIRQCLELINKLDHKHRDENDETCIQCKQKECRQDCKLNGIFKRAKEFGYHYE